MKPAYKVTGFEKVLNDLTVSVYGRSRTKSIENNICVTCGNKADTFKDEVSRKEYTISGMCQNCQDDVFG